MRPNIPPTPEDHIARRIAAHRKQPRRERSKDHKAAMHQRGWRDRRKAKLQQARDERYARRAFRRFLKEMFGDTRVWKPVRFRPARHLGARRPGKSKADSRSRLHLPSVGHDIIDRKGRRGVFLSIGYDGAKDNRLGVFRRRIEYAALSGEVVRTPGGLPMLVSNVAATIDEAVAIGDEVEAFNRAERTNGKVCFNLVIGFPRSAGRREREKILRIFTQRAFGDEGLPYVGFIHEPKRAGQIHNPHGHVTASLRPVHRKGPYRYLISKDLRVDLDGEEGMLRMRRILAEVTTKVMREAGFEQEYTHLSNAARGLTIMPQKKLGKGLSEAAKRGEHVSANEHNKGLVKGARRHVFAQLKAQIYASTGHRRLPILGSPPSPAAAVLPALRRSVAEPLARVVRRPARRDVVRIDLSKPGASHRFLDGGKPVSAKAADILSQAPASGRYPQRLRHSKFPEIGTILSNTASAGHLPVRAVQSICTNPVSLGSIISVNLLGQKLPPLVRFEAAKPAARMALRELPLTSRARQFVKLIKSERSARLVDLSSFSGRQAADTVFMIPQSIRIAGKAAMPRAGRVAPAAKHPHMTVPMRAALAPMVLFGPATKPAALRPAKLAAMPGVLPKLSVITANVRPAAPKLIVAEPVAKASDVVLGRSPLLLGPILMLRRVEGVAQTLSIPRGTPVIEVSKLPRIEPAATTLAAMPLANPSLKPAPVKRPAAATFEPFAKMVLPTRDALAAPALQAPVPMLAISNAAKSALPLRPMIHGPRDFKAILPPASRTKRRIERVARPQSASTPGVSLSPSKVRAPKVRMAKILVRTLREKWSTTITTPTPNSAQKIAMPITKPRASMACLRDTTSDQAAQHPRVIKSLRNKIEAMRTGLTADATREPPRMDALLENGGAAQTARVAASAQPNVGSSPAKGSTPSNSQAPDAAAQVEEILRPRIFGPDGLMHRVAYDHPAAVAQRARFAEQLQQRQPAANTPLSVDKKDAQAAHRHAVLHAQHSRGRR